MRLSIIIVNFNVKYFLEHCLLSVQRAIKTINAEIIVVDNCSTDQSINYLQPLFPDVVFIVNQQNTGFGKANNQGLRKAKGDFILFLNPDTLVPEDCFIKCLEVFENNPQVGALGIKMLDGKGQFLKESKRGFPSITSSFFKLSGISSLFPGSRIFDHYYMGHLNHTKDQYVEVLAGAFMFVSKAVLEKTGAFDEAFFMYGEDIDLSYRIYKAGYKNYYLSAPEIIHFKGKSTAKSSVNYVKNFYQAMSTFVNKHYKGAKHNAFGVALHGAIWSRAAIRLVTNKLQSSRKVNSTLFVTTLIVGAGSSVNALQQEFQNSNDNPCITVRPDVEEAVLYIKKYPSSSVYICEQDLDFSAIIKIVSRTRHPFILFYSGKSVITGY